MLSIDNVIKAVQIGCESPIHARRNWRTGSLLYFISGGLGGASAIQYAGSAGRARRLFWIPICNNFCSGAAQQLHGENDWNFVMFHLGDMFASH